MNKVIFFSGLDCSGKSTQINFLKATYDLKNKKNLVFWSRGGYTPGFQKLKDLMRYISGSKLPKPGKSKERDKALSNPIIIKIWLTIAMLDLFFYYVIFLRFKYLLGYNIICDRFLMDTKIDFNLSYPKSRANKWFLWRLIQLLAIKPNHHFVSTIPVNESVIRSKNKFEPFPDSPQTLENRLKLYKKYIRNNKKLIHIDGMRDIDKIKSQVHGIIFSC